ncbi:MAG: hypothetical protein Q9170_004502 [Blastenia crenularia]
MDLWYGLTLEQRQHYMRGQRKARYELEMAEFNANIPLSPSVSGSSDDESDYEIEDGSVTDKRAIQRWNRYRRDYRKQGPVDDVPSSQEPFPFFRLPFDVRRMVYTLLVKRSRPVIQLEPDGSGKHPGGPVELRAAVASKQLFTEVMSTFFEENTLELEIIPGGSIGLPVLFQSGAMSAGFWPMWSIKQIQLSISFGRKEESNFIRAELEKLSRGLQDCDLARMQITAYCRKNFELNGVDESVDRIFDEAFDKVLGQLETMRGVKELVFVEEMDEDWMRSPGSMELRSVGTKGYRERLQSLVTQPKSTAGTD